MYSNNILTLRIDRLRLFALLSLLSTILFVRPAAAEPFDCAHNHCGLLVRNNNPDLVVGTVEAVATAEQMKHVFKWAKANGYWKDLPVDAHGYLETIQLLSLAIETPKGQNSITVLMTRQEFDAAPFDLGALVRYSPHDAAHDAITYPDPAKQSYWVLVGCVAQLCATVDKACYGRYQMGRFSRKSGIQLEIKSGEPVAHGVIIDPETILPKSPTNQK